MLDRLINSQISALNENSAPGGIGVQRRLALAFLLPVSFVVKLMRILGQKFFRGWLSPEIEGQDALQMYGYSMSLRMRALFKATDPARVSQIRRENYSIWIEFMSNLPGCSALYDVLPDGCTPLYMPVLCSDHKRAIEYFGQRNIEVSPWWFDERDDIDWQEHDNLLSIKRSMLVLPVHHLIDPAELRRRLSYEY